MDVPRQLKGVTLLVNQTTFIAALEERADSFVPEVEILGVSPLEVLYGLRKICPEGLKKEVVVILHEAVREYPKLEFRRRFCEEMKKRFIVPFIEENRAFFDTPIEDVIESSFELNPPGTSHECLIIKKFTLLSIHCASGRAEELLGSDPRGSDPGGSDPAW